MIIRMKDLHRVNGTGTVMMLTIMIEDHMNAQEIGNGQQKLNVTTMTKIKALMTQMIVGLILMLGNITMIVRIVVIKQTEIGTVDPNMMIMMRPAIKHQVKKCKLFLKTITKLSLYSNLMYSLHLSFNIFAF